MLRLPFSILLFCIASFANRCFDGIGTSRNFDVVRLRARDGQHERGGVSEIALESDGAGALRQLRIQGIQLEVDIAELPLGIGDALIQLNGHKRIAGQRYGLNTVVRIRSRMDGLILGGNVLNSTGNVLFDLLRRGSGPWTSRHAEAHGNVRILALRHGCIAELAPNEHSGQKHPGDVRVLDKKPRDIATIADLLPVFVCHCSVPLGEDLDEVAVLQTGGSNDDDFFAWIYTVNCHITLVGFTKCDLAQMRHPFAALFSGDENRVVSS